MPGAIWKLENLAEKGSRHQGDQAGYDAAKAAVIAVGGGMLQVGPGLEGLNLGALPASVILVRTTNLGRYIASGFTVADLLDPTKRVFFDPVLISSGVERSIQLPNWNGFLPLPPNNGVAGQFLRSNAPGQPTFDTIPAPTNNLLDGVNHLDTVARACVRGHLVVGAAGNLWDRLAVGAANHLIGSDGTDVVYFSPAAVAALVAAVIEHNNLLRLKPFQVTNVSWTNGSADLTHASGGFANVRVGDFIFLGNNTTGSTQGARVLTKTSDNLITADLTKDAGESAMSNVTAIFQPGDHWDDTLALDLGVGSGLMMTMGRGTYNAPLRTSGTFQELRGPIRWRPHGSGNLVSDFRVQGSGSTTTPTGFALEKPVGGPRAYFFVGLLTAQQVYSYPDVSGQIIIEGGVQSLSSKTFDIANKINVDGTTTRTVFASSGAARIAPDVSLVSALRNVKWPDFAGIYRVDGAAVTFANGDTTPSVALSRVFQTNNAGATTITALDDGADGVEIIIRAGDANTTFQHDGGGTLRCEGAANKTLGVDDIIRFVRIGGVWYQSAPVVVI